MVGECGAESGAEGGGIGGAGVVGGEGFVGAVAEGDDYAAVYAGLAGEDGFDFGELDAEAADFYLLILATEELDDAAFWDEADAVAGAVEFFAGEIDEFFRSEGGLVPIAECEAIAADVEFAGVAVGDGGQRVVEDANGGVGDGLADGDGGEVEIGRGDGVAAGEGGGFRGAVAVDEAELGMGGHDFADMRDGKNIAAREKLTERGESVGLFIDDEIEKAGGEPE